MVRFAHAHTQSQSHEQTQHLNMANSLSVRPHITKQYFARLGMHILQKNLKFSMVGFLVPATANQNTSNEFQVSTSIYASIDKENCKHTRVRARA